MKILPPEIPIDLYNEGFGDTDLLQRKNVGKALSELVDRINDPLVIALDGQWGTGKTHFLKRWVGAHTIENGSHSTTVYFDAFANDYLNDPLPALVSALIERLPSGNEAKLEKVKAAAFKLARPLTRIGLAVSTFGATEALNDIGDAVAEAVSSEAASGLEKYWKEETGRRKAMIEFQNAMKSLAKPKSDEETGSSLVFVIDELDRCRPDYALEVLEVIKHFFTVPHVHFILGVNLRVLENSVHARYGGNTDGHAYLKKFIQISLQLPFELGEQHNTRKANLVYLDHLIEEMGIPPHISTPLRGQTAQVSKANQISMREMGKIVSSISLANEYVLTTPTIYPGWIFVMVDLVISKNVRPDLYPKFLNATITEDELSSYLGATPMNLTEMIDDKLNPEYDHPTFWKYHTWLYLIQNGLQNRVSSDFATAIKRQFGDFGLREAGNKLPMKIHKKWLDQFSFYSS